MEFICSFTEPTLYFDDIRQHGLTSFTAVYLFINMMLVLGFSWRFINSINKKKNVNFLDCQKTLSESKFG